MIKNIIIILFIYSLLSNCSNVAESLSMKKKDGVDEFLIEKKSSSFASKFFEL